MATNPTDESVARIELARARRVGQRLVPANAEDQPGDVSLIAEQQVLGSLLIDSDAWKAVRGVLAEDHFSRLDHVLIFRAIRALAEQATPHDIVTVEEQLRRGNELDDAGGQSYLLKLARETPTPKNIQAYAQILESIAQRQNLAIVSRELIRTDVAPGELIDSALRRLQALKPTESASVAVPPIRIRCGFEILERPVPSRWLLRPYLEECVLGLLYGDLGTLKSFIALDWSLRLATQGTPTLYLSAEGKGLERRMRSWCLRYAPDRPPEQTMMAAQFFAMEHSIALPHMVGELEAAIDAQAAPPKLIAVDTLSRYGGALDENKAQDVAVLIAAADRLRLKYGATVLFVHHTGHAAKDRARGSYALMAATDAHFLVERPDPQQLLVTVTTGRLKDSESPPPFSLAADVIDLGLVDEDGQKVTSLALRPTTEVATPKRREPTGANVREALAALRSLPGPVFTMGDAQQALKPALPDRRRRAEALAWLQKNQWVTATIGGLRLEA